MMTNEDFLKDVCPNHTENSKWNRSELLHILELYKKQLRLHFVSNNEVTFCTCGNPSGEGNIQMVNDEDLLYFCCDCEKQVQNDC